MNTKTKLLAILFVLVFSQPLVDFLPLSSYDQKRVIEVIIISLALIFTAFSKEQVCLSFRVKLALILFFTVGVVSALNSEVQSYAMVEVCLYIGLFRVIIFVATASSQNYTTVFRVFSFSLLSISVLYLISVMASYVAGILNQISPYWFNFFPGYANPRFFNQFQIWTFPFITYAYIYLCSRSNVYQRTLLTVFVALWWMLLVLSASRGALLATVVSAFITLIVYRRHAVQLCSSSLLLLFWGVCLYYLCFDLSQVVLDNTSGQMSEFTRTDTDIRLILWQAAIQYTLEYPLLGIGPMHYALNDPLYGLPSIGALWLPTESAAHPHNSVLQSLAEWGGIATLCILFVLINAIRVWLIRFNYSTLEDVNCNEISFQSVTIFWSLSAGLIYSAVSGVLVMPQSQLMASLVFGLGLALCVNTAVSKETICKRMFRLFSSVVILAVFLLSIATTLENLNYKPSNDNHIQTLAPRFWFIGGLPHK